MTRAGVRVDQNAVDRLIEDAVMPALVVRAEQIVNTAKRLAPVRSGRLRRGISYEERRNADGITGPFVAVSYARGTFGHMAEFGTEHSDPQPFLRPAVD